jgi:hypothetical protein
VRVELYQGHVRAISRRSPNSLYRPDLGSFDMTGYNPRHAEGFIRLFGLPLAVAAEVQKSPAEADANGSTPESPARIDYASILVPEADSVR